MRNLTKKMEEAAENLEFERAARIRDRLAAIKRMGDRQKVVALKVPEQDIIALAQGPERNCFEVFRFMNGRLCDRETYLMGEIGEPEAARSEFIERYYSMRDRVPPRVSLDGPASDMELLSEWLSQKAGRKVLVYVPQKGEQAQLVEMCRNNAAEQLAQSVGRTGREASALDELPACWEWRIPLPISKRMTSATWLAGIMSQEWWCLKMAARLKVRTVSSRSKRLWGRTTTAPCGK